MHKLTNNFADQLSTSIYLDIVPVPLTSVFGASVNTEKKRESHYDVVIFL